MTMSATNADHEYYIVDFDRTLVDSDKLLEVFIEIAHNYFDIPREQIEKADADVKQRGDSFDTAKYVRDHLNAEDRSEEWADLEKQFIHESRALNYLLPGAAELLEWLAANGKRYGILTYGNPLWQHIKLTAAGFNHVRHIIMEQKEKGKLISTWQRPDGTFHLPDALGRGEADYIVMIDDKAVSFAEFPGSPSKGYWVLDPAHELLSQQGTVPANVTRYDNLYDAIKAL
jgi:phosphoglycolate phosphatase-like HAD superfamily hydrolase